MTSRKIHRLLFYVNILQREISDVIAQSVLLIGSYRWRALRATWINKYICRRNVSRLHPISYGLRDITMHAAPPARSHGVSRQSATRWRLKITQHYASRSLCRVPSLSSTFVHVSLSHLSRSPRRFGMPLEERTVCESGLSLFLFSASDVAGPQEARRGPSNSTASVLSDERADSSEFLCARAGKGARRREAVIHLDPARLGTARMGKRSLNNCRPLKFCLT